jgi:hypothetical protein
MYRLSALYAISRAKLPKQPRISFKRDGFLRRYARRHAGIGSGKNPADALPNEQNAKAKRNTTPTLAP